MKKTISLALALVLALSLAACGSNGNTDSSADVPADANDPADHRVGQLIPTMKSSPPPAATMTTPVDDAPGAVDISDADNLNYMLTFPAADAVQDRRRRRP